MSAQPPTSERRSAATTEPERAPQAIRILGLAAVGFGVAALAAATFVLSYPAIHVLALRAGVAPRLARGYPLLIDAMLLIVLAAVLALRSASLPSRLLAWGTLLAVLGVAAGADALHAAGRKLPHHVAAIIAAVLPWVLVFLAFALLLAMLRYARVRRMLPAAPPARRPGVATEPDPATEPDLTTEPDLANDRDPAIEPAPADRSEDAASEPADAARRYLTDDADAEMAALSSVTAAEDEHEDPGMPVFHRMWSSPTPPAD
jgi:Protein of unknown function (DUF2637)